MKTKLHSTSEHSSPNHVAADVSRLKHPRGQSGLTSVATLMGSACTLRHAVFLLLATLVLWLAPRAPAQTAWGRALSFDGVNDYVEVQHTGALNAFPLTVSAWIKTTNWDANRQAGVVNKYRSGSANGFNVYLSEGHIRAWYFADASNYLYYADGGNVADGVWHHVAFTVGTNDGKLYVDGALRDSINWTGIPGAPTTEEPLRLGFYPPGIVVKGYFPGLMDDVRIWNVERSADEIREHLGHPLSGTESNLVAYWKLDELSGAAVQDSTSNVYDGLAYHCTRTPSSIPTWGTALWFRGFSYVMVPHADALNAFPLTVSAWINTTNREAGRDPGVVNKYRSGSANGFNLYLREGRIRAWYFKDINNYVWDGGQGLDGGDVADAVWHHVAFTVGTNDGKLYVDGALRALTNWTGIPGPPTTTEPLWLGLYPPGTLRLYGGLMDEVRIWNAERSAEEIREHLGHPLSGTESNLVAYWNFDERAGTTVFDRTTNGHNGQTRTLESGPVWTSSMPMMERVVTIYFCGTGITWEWWDPNISKFDTPELVSTLYQEQIETRPILHHKKIVDGIGSGQGDWDLIMQAAPSFIEDVLNGRGWNTCLNEGIDYLNEVLNDYPQDQVILNLVGFSRGGVSTMMMADAFKDNPRVKHINIIAFDPVAGDSSFDYRLYCCLPEKVKHYVGFYALDERTDMFWPVEPTAASANTKMWTFTVPGSHETLVGNIQRDGHSLSLLYANVYDTNLLACSWLTKVIAVELLGSSEWGHVRFNWDWYEGVTNEQVLASKFIDNLEQMNAYPHYGYMHEVPFNPLGLTSYHTAWFGGPGCWGISPIFGLQHYPRCAHKWDCQSQRKTTFGLSAATIPALDSSVWAKLTEFGSLDFDGDGVDFADDNCPEMFNPDQLDVNGNGIGDVCEAVLAIEGLENGDYSISWVHGSGAVLQMATQVQGPWTNVANQANPYITTANLPAAFFRLKIQ